MKDFLWLPVVLVGGVDVSQYVVGTISVSAALNESRTAFFVLPKDTLSTNPTADVNSSVEIRYVDVHAEEEHVIFGGIVRSVEIEANTGAVTYNCSDMFAERIQNADAALVSMIEPHALYSEHVFGPREGKPNSQLFIDLLSTTKMDVVSQPNGSITLSAFNVASPTSPRIYTEADIVRTTANISNASGNANGSSSASDYLGQVGEQASLADSPLKARSAYKTQLRGTRPLNQIIAEVQWRRPRLKERDYGVRFNSMPNFADATRGSLQNGTYDPTKSAWLQMVQGTGMHAKDTVFVDPPEVETTTGTGGVPLSNSYNSENRKILFREAYTDLSRRYVQDVTTIYRKIVKCSDSIARHGLYSQKKTIAIEMTSFNADVWAQDYTRAPIISAGPGLYGEYSYDLISRSQHSPEKPDSEKNDDEAAAQEALDVLTAQAEREIIKDHEGGGAGGVDGNGSSADGASVTFKTPLWKAPLSPGEYAEYQTSIWNASGRIKEVVIELDPRGAALAQITLTALILPPLNDSGNNGATPGLDPGTPGGSEATDPGEDEELPEGQNGLNPPGETDPDTTNGKGEGAPYLLYLPTFVFGVDAYSSVGPDPSKVNGYFALSEKPGPDEDFPGAQIRFITPAVSETSITELRSYKAEVTEVALNTGTFG